MVCNGGVYLFTLMDWHTASWAILLLGMAEVVVLSWVYGMQRTFDNLCDMNIRLKGVLRGYWWITLMVLSPVTCLAVFFFAMTDIKPTEFGDYVFPAWADGLGWAMGASTLVPFAVLLVYRLIKGPVKYKGPMPCSISNTHFRFLSARTWLVPPIAKLGITRADE